MKTIVTILSAVLFLDLIPITTVHAELLAPARVHVPWKYIEQQLNRTMVESLVAWGHHQESMQFQAGDFSVQIDSIDLAIQYPSQQSVLNIAAGAGLFKLSGLNIDLFLSGLHVRQVIERVIGGIVVRIPVNLDCGPVFLNHPNLGIEGGLLIDVSSADKISIDLHLEKILFNDVKWNISEMNCQGPEGAEKMITDEIRAKIAHESSFKLFLNSFFLPKIKKNVLDNLLKISNSLTDQWSSISQSPLLYKFVDMRTEDSGIWFDLTLASKEANRPDLLSFNDSNLNLKQLSLNQPQIFFSRSSVMNIAEELLRQKEDWISYNLHEQADFQRLMRSRLLQFFVWIDLWNYKKHSPFILLIKKPVVSNLSPLEDGFLQGDQKVYAILRSFRKAQWWDYVYINGSGHSQVYFEILNDRILLKSQIRWDQFYSEYTSEYLNKFPNSGRLPSGLFRQATEKFLNNKEISIPLPSLSNGLGDKLLIRDCYWQLQEHYVCEFQ